LSGGMAEAKVPKIDRVNNSTREYDVRLGGGREKVVGRDMFMRAFVFSADISRDDGRYTCCNERSCLQDQCDRINGPSRRTSAWCECLDVVQ